MGVYDIFCWGYVVVSFMISFFVLCDDDRGINNIANYSYTDTTLTGISLLLLLIGVMVLNVCVLGI